MTFGQYIENPMGKSNAVFAGREQARELYTNKFDMIYMREAGKIDRTLYFDNAHDNYIVHFKIPSETVKGFYYDVVIRFFTNDPAQHTSSTLKGYDVQFFSNDPAFVYTYMYVFRTHGMLIEDLKGKCPKASLTDAPIERNAYQVPGYVKSIYFAYILMSRTDLFLKSTYHDRGKRYMKVALLNQVASFVNKMEERQDKEAKQKAQAKREKADKQRIGNKTVAPPVTEKNRANMVKRVGTVGTVKHRGTGNIGRIGPKKKIAKSGK